MEVAVVIPAWQAARTIAATLASVQAQVLAPAEIIVVDDGSTDETPSIVTAAAAEDRRIRLLRQPNAGPMTARNQAIAASTAPLIAPLDADDLWHPLYLVKMMVALGRSDRPGFAYALHHVIDEKGAILATPPTPPVEGWAYHRHLLVNMVGCGSAAVFRREALLVAGGYDIRTRVWGGAEDYLLQLRIAATQPIACVPRRLVGYRRVAGSVSDAPLRMARARRMAVETMLAEHPAACTAIRRWVAADSRRTAAALLAKQGRWGRAVVPALLSLTDPAAALADGTQRLGNRIASSPMFTADRFSDVDARVEAAPVLPRLLAERLRRLELLDQRQRPI